MQIFARSMGVGFGMSKALGVTVLALGVGVLGWWGSTHNAHRIEHFITKEAEAAVQGSVHGAQTRVSGRDIELSGVIDGTEEEARLLAALDGVPGRRLVTSQATVLPVVAPFVLDVVKQDGALTATGNVPTEATRGMLGLGDQAAGLVLAAGAPGGWADLAKAGVAALGPMIKGRMQLADGALKLSGTVLGPDEAAAVAASLTGVPEGSVTQDLTLLDDGSPANYTLDYAAATGAQVSGKLPKGVDLAGIASALGLAEVSGEITQGLLGSGATAAALGVFKDWMDKIEMMRVQLGENGIAAEVQVAPGTDADGLSAALKAAGMEPAVSVAAITGTNGDTRVNAASGIAQRLMGGYWLAVPKVEMSLAGCQSAADGVLAANTINFVSGSEELDASAVSVINELGAIMARCSEEAGLRAVIGGYTDSSGDALANLALSQRRAIAVRRELIARGVAGAALKSIGFGDANPVADNTTENGRAKNRRTTITWSQ